MSEKPSVKDIVVIGFLLFSTFFGAGNLIFPPYLGMEAGSKWMIGIVGFLIGDVILAILAVIANCKFEDVNKGILTRSGERFAAVIGCIMVLCVGPLLVIPRTASTTFEIAVLPSISEEHQLLLSIFFSVLFFTLTLILCIRPSKVADYIGKVLTPCLLTMLALMILKGILTPLGTPRSEALLPSVFGEGLMQGYQTFDAMGGIIIAILVVTAITAKGYTKISSRVQVAVKSGLIAGIGLTLVYVGLCYLGSSVSGVFDPSVSQPKLLISITHRLFGEVGTAVMAICVTLACLTTAVGLTSSVSTYFFSISKEKLKYEWIVTAICIFSAVISNFGVTQIIKLSVPILTILYPGIVVSILLSLFTNQIKSDRVFQTSVYTAMLCGLLIVLKVPIMERLPLSSAGLAWITPVCLAFLIGWFLPQKTREGS